MFILYHYLLYRASTFLYGSLTEPAFTDLTEGTEYEIGVNLLTRQSFDLFRAGNTGGPRTLIELGTYDSKCLDDLIGNGMSRGQVVTTTTNNAPVFDETSFSFTALENAAVGDTVGTVSATDPDTRDTLTYSITESNGDGHFAIDSTSGRDHCGGEPGLCQLRPVPRMPA